MASGAADAATWAEITPVSTKPRLAVTAFPVCGTPAHLFLKNVYIFVNGL